jgi:hypothetical protein
MLTLVSAGFWVALLLETLRKLLEATKNRVLGARESSDAVSKTPHGPPELSIRMATEVARDPSVLVLLDQFNSGPRLDPLYPRVPAYLL